MGAVTRIALVASVACGCTLECVERVPDDAVLQSCVLTGPSGCPGVQPICCSYALTTLCTDRELRGWSCNAP